MPSPGRQAVALRALEQAEAAPLAAVEALGALSLARGETLVGARLAGLADRTRAAQSGLDVEGWSRKLEELFVVPSVRGRGIGSSLLDAMVGSLGALGVNALHLMVRPDNDRARELYEKRGFQTAPRIMMTKRLASGRV